MSIPPDSPWRGCASNFPQPVDEHELLAAQNLVETVYYYNCRQIHPPLPDITYRSSYRDQDVTRHVFRWDVTPYQQVFVNGFQARRQQGIPDNLYFDLNHYVHHGGRPLDSTRPTTHAFVSTTLNGNWRPPVQGEQEIPVYRYEIYAPGGIWVAETLGDLYKFPAQDEVCFVAGIAPQYIRSAQLFLGSRPAGSQYPRWRRADNILRVNGRVNPQSHPFMLLPVQRPVFDYVENGTRKLLTISIFKPQQQLLEGRREKGQVVSGEDAIDWYARRVADSPSYINAAVRSSKKNEAYIFMKNEYALLSYVPGTTNDKIVKGPLLICDGYLSLIGTTFGEHGIDCAFDTDGSEAFIFSGNLCAYIDYAPVTTKDKILSGPMTITAMFPFFKPTVFGRGIDSAFRSTLSKEAYLFKGDQCALINYHSKKLISIRKIIEVFRSLKGTIFASGIEAAFASHKVNEAYLFKGDQYALFNFVPGTTNDHIIGGVKPILPNWPSLRSILPHKNRGLDAHDHHNQPQADRDHDD